MAEIFIRNETTKDYRQVEKILKEAFDGVYSPLAKEHVIVYRLRKSKDYIAELSFVAEVGGVIVGYITASIGTIKSENGEKIANTIILGPIGVLPKYQKQGVGKRLMDELIKEAKFREYRHIFLYGNPKFYSQFGFVNAVKVNCKTKEGKNFPEFMVLKLNNEAFNGGYVHETEIFTNISEEETIKFNSLLDKAINTPKKINKLAANINTIFLWATLLLGVVFLLLRTFNVMMGNSNVGGFLVSIGASIFAIGNSRFIGGAKKSAIFAYCLSCVTIGIGIFMFL